MKFSIRLKIIIGFTISVIICAVLGIYSYYAIKTLSRYSAEHEVIQEANEEISHVLTAHYLWRQNLTVAVLTGTEFTGSYDPTACALGLWRNSDEAKAIDDAEILDLLAQIDEPHALIHTEAKIIMDMIENGNSDEALDIFIEQVLPTADHVISLLSNMTERYDTIINDHLQLSNAFEARTALIIFLVIFLSVIVNVFIETIVIESVMRPLKRLISAANSVTSGNFSVNLSYPINDEIGQLTTNFATLVDTFRSMLGDMNTMASKHAAGDIDYMMDSDRYEGEFKDVIISTNSMIREYIDTVEKILAIAQKYADGDFNARLERLPGKKVNANNILDAVSENLNDVENSIKYMLDSATAGKLDSQVDESNFTGDWKDIIIGMNKLLKTVDEPLVEAESVLKHVSDGKLDATILGKYNGRFGSVSNSINKTIESLSLYIQDISYTLNELASDNFNITVTKEYNGDFSKIKISLNAIIDRLNNVMYEISGAATQVANGAAQISKSSMTLSQGASEQSSAVEQLNTTIDLIYSQASKNSEYSTDANNRSVATKDNAMRGNSEMSDMLKSMSEINAASQNISKIIKVIDDIAFQTNLLALNAAVEAARAGEHGKGFAVVAEEVRSLAARTSNAAKETTELIEQTIAKIGEGAKIADDTAIALNKIVEGVADVSEIINEIEISSKTQTTSISQINDGIKQISQVTLENSATSEQSAAAAQELSGQSDLLKEMINRFQLR